MINNRELKDSELRQLQETLGRSPDRITVPFLDWIRHNTNKVMFFDEVSKSDLGKPQGSQYSRVYSFQDFSIMFKSWDYYEDVVDENGKVEYENYTYVEMVYIPFPIKEIEGGIYEFEGSERELWTSKEV